MHRSIAMLILSLAIFSAQNIIAQFDKEALEKAAELLKQKRMLRDLKIQLNLTEKPDVKEITAEQYLKKYSPIILKHCEKVKNYEEWRERNELRKHGIVMAVMTIGGALLSTYWAFNNRPDIAGEWALFIGITCAATVYVTFRVSYPQKKEEDSMVALKLALDDGIQHYQYRIDVYRDYINDKK